MNRSKSLSLQIGNLNYGQVVQEIVRLGAQPVPAYVCFVDAPVPLDAYQNPRFVQ